MFEVRISYLKPPPLSHGYFLRNFSGFWYMPSGIAQTYGQQRNQEVEYLREPCAKHLSAYVLISFRPNSNQFSLRDRISSRWFLVNLELPSKWYFLGCNSMGFCSNGYYVTWNSKATDVMSHCVFWQWVIWHRQPWLWVLRNVTVCCLLEVRQTAASIVGQLWHFHLYLVI